MSVDDFLREQHGRQKMRMDNLRKPAYIQKFFIDLKYFFEEHLPPKCFLAHKMRIIHTLVVSNFLQD
ncbi:Uncharacterised protein [Chlamydia abortus]|nr:hypothetical protein CEF07_01575 [Chlamydia abortus]SGA30044.1 Uncharacterised protein [Chlamydia abortus]